ncbi:hypothetical protein [Polyangium aurulentum]|uniref:hypothetical protein n=1 Tax=Polyangium aurulentum TaxID=2567896 RepID=UPI0010ADE90B|nr:hypothetical protein [Polyangium aurulentum]UQA56079.1 hypothetical protein E8A73_032830 [Polyangium aurulentum]
MRRTTRATWMLLISMAALGGVYGPGCSNEADDPERNGESPSTKGECAPADDDGDPCTVEGCKGGGNEHVVVVGLPCGVNDSLACNANGKCAGCTTSDQCGTGSECAPWACNAGVCELTFTNPGTPISQQTPGDCLRVQCTGTGEEQTVADDLDVPVEPCYDGMCSNGTPSTTPSKKDTKCDVNGGKSCDGLGNCVECTGNDDCGADPFTFCDPKYGTCHSCIDGVKNGDETDIDCGGYNCTDCNQGKGCEAPTDCKTNFCADGVCCNAACNEACKACNLSGQIGTCDVVDKYSEDASYGNGQSCLNSAGLACTGAGSCAKALGAMCTANGDCASLRCADPDANGQKTCLKAPGDTCAQNAECFNNTCANGFCAP